MNARIPDPIEIDSRDCELCGRKIDQHECVDHGEGPEFYCYPDDDIVTLWELSDRRDAWRHTGEAPPPAAMRNSDIGNRRPPPTRPYSPPQLTCDAFFYLVGLKDAPRLAAWLRNHPKDAPLLLELLEHKTNA